MKIEREIGDVWQALITKSIVDSYYFLPVSADVTEAGQEIYYGSEKQQMIFGKVLQLDPPTLYKHSFLFAGETQTPTTVTYSLASEGAATRLTVTHEGYARDTQSYADIAGGWPVILDNLKEKLETN